MNLMDIVKRQLGGDMVGKIAGMLGESPEKTQGALGAAVPTVLAGLLGSASSKDGASKLFDAVKNTDGNMLGNLAGMLGGGQGSQLSQTGGNLLGSLLGGGSMVQTLAGVLGKFTGLNLGSMTGLLGIVAPLIMGVLKKQSGAAGIADASGLAGMLAGQKSNILGAMPPGLSQQLGNVPGLGSLLGGVLGGGGNVAQTAVNTVASAAPKAAGGGGLVKLLLPLIIIGGLVWYFFGRGGVAPAPKTTPAPAATTPAAPAVSPVAKLTGDIGSFFGDATKALEGVKDAASAEAAIPALNGLSTKADGLLSAFKGLAGADKTGVASAVSSALGKLQPIIDAAMKIPGVKEKLGPTVEGLLTKLKGFSS
jgi:hypothetical protein